MSALQPPKLHWCHRDPPQNSTDAQGGNCGPFRHSPRVFLRIEVTTFDLAYQVTFEINASLLPLEALPFCKAVAVHMTQNNVSLAGPIYTFHIMDPLAETDDSISESGRLCDSGGEELMLFGLAHSSPRPHRCCGFLKGSALSKEHLSQPKRTGQEKDKA